MRIAAVLYLIVAAVLLVLAVRADWRWGLAAIGWGLGALIYLLITAPTIDDSED